MVVVHTAPGCFPCKMTKRRLDERGIEYREVDISQDPEALDHIKNLGYASAPVVIAPTGEHWSGFDPDRIDALAA